MRLSCVLVVVTLGACAAKEIPLAAGHPADPNATAAPAGSSLDVLGSAFSPDALMPKASGASDPHEHHKSGGHAH